MFDHCLGCESYHLQSDADVQGCVKLCGSFTLSVWPLFRIIFHGESGFFVPYVVNSLILFIKGVLISLTHLTNSFFYNLKAAAFRFGHLPYYGCFLQIYLVKLSSNLQSPTFNSKPSLKGPG